MACGTIDFLAGGALKDVSIIGGTITGATLSDCDLSGLEGGTVKNSTVVNSTIADSRLRNSELDTADITHLKSIDTNSADRIQEAIGKLTILDPSVLQLIATGFNSNPRILKDAFALLITEGLEEACIRSDAALKIAAAISELSPAQITSLVTRSLVDNAGTAKAIGQAITKLSPEERKNIMSAFSCEGVADVIGTAISNLPAAKRQALFDHILDSVIAEKIADKVAELGSVKLTALFDQVFTPQMAAIVMNSILNLPVAQLEDLARSLFTPDICNIIVQGMCRLGSDSLKTLADILYEIAHHGCVPVPFPSCKPVASPSVCGCPPPATSSTANCACGVPQSMCTIPVPTDTTCCVDCAREAEKAEEATRAQTADLASVASRVNSISTQNVKDIITTMASMPKDTIKPLAEELYRITHDDEWGECPDPSDVTCDCQRMPGGCGNYTNANMDAGELP